MKAEKRPPCADLDPGIFHSEVCEKCHWICEQCGEEYCPYTDIGSNYTDCSTCLGDAL